MNDLKFYIHFHSISVISGPWEDDDEWLCVQWNLAHSWKRPPEGLELMTTGSSGQGLTLKAPSKIAADDTFIFLLLSFEENKA